MDLRALWSAVLGSAVPTSIISLLMLYLTHRNNKAMERHISEFQQNIFMFIKWREERNKAFLVIYNAFCDYLNFLRRNLYFDTKGACMDPMHEFHRTIERQIVYLDDDDTMAKKVQTYKCELLEIRNWAHAVLREQGEAGRREIRMRLDFKMPSYLLRLRRNINNFLEPNYKVDDEAIVTVHETANQTMIDKLSQAQSK